MDPDHTDLWEGIFDINAENAITHSSEPKEFDFCAPILEGNAKLGVMAKLETVGMVFMDEHEMDHIWVKLSDRDKFVWFAEDEKFLPEQEELEGYDSWTN